MVGLAVTAGAVPVAGDFPDDAGIGATPHRCAQAASLRSLPGVIPGRDEQQRRSARAEPVYGEQARVMGGNQRDDELVQAAELTAGNRARRPSSRSATRTA